MPKGQIPWNKGKTGVYSEETRKKMGIQKIGKKQSPEHIAALVKARKGKVGFHNKGKKMSEEQKHKIQKTINLQYKNGRTVWNKGKEYPQIKGKNHFHW